MKSPNEYTGLEQYVANLVWQEKSRCADLPAHIPFTIRPLPCFALLALPHFALLTLHVLILLGRTLFSLLALTLLAFALLALTRGC